MHPASANAARPARRPTTSREVVVTAREQITEHMLRLTLGGDDDLAPVVHGTPGSWVKLFVPDPGDPSRAGEHGRAYTVRGFNPISNEIDIDVFLHDGGTMPRWAESCAVGETARVGGPRPSGAPGRDAASMLLFGDETSMPAIAAILERERGHRPIHAWIELADDADRQEITLSRGAGITWLRREAGAAPGSALVHSATRLRFEPDAGVWFAAEAGAAQRFRGLVRGLGVADLHVQGYWRAGVGDYRE